MLVPASWEYCAQCELPRAQYRTFHDLFWDIVRTYAGHSCESLRLLLESGAALSKSVRAGYASIHDAVRPVVPPELLQPRAIPPMVPIEDLPDINCCENRTAIMEVRALCFRYGECVASLLSATMACSTRWGRLTMQERELIKAALVAEKASRFNENSLFRLFTDLNFSGRRLKQLTSDVTSFTNITTLVLSNNSGLESIPYLPPACRVLVACGCSVRDVCASSSLVFLGLAYNAVERLEFLNGLPELRVLDLTSNRVFSFEEAIETLRSHQRLEEVTLVGCPIALLDDYREHLAARCPLLQRLDGIQLDRRVMFFLENKAIDPTVLLRIKLTQLEGLATLVHFPLVNEGMLLSNRETKGSKGKKKLKNVVLGPVYECTTRISLRGLWGASGAVDGDAVVVIDCENISIVPDRSAAVPNQHQEFAKKKLQTSVAHVEDVCPLNHVVTASVPLSAGLSHSLACPFILEMVVYDELRFSSGKTISLSCNIGLLRADVSGLLLDTAPFPRCLTVREHFAVNEVALEEKLLHAREIREKMAATEEIWKWCTPSSAAAPGLSTVNSVCSPRRGRSVANNSACGTQERIGSEAKWREAEAEAEELNLLANLEERRVEELRELRLAATLEFSLGSLPKNAEEESPRGGGRARNVRRRQSEKSKR